MRRAGGQSRTKLRIGNSIINLITSTKMENGKKPYCKQSEGVMESKRLVLQAWRAVPLPRLWTLQNDGLQFD